MALSGKPCCWCTCTSNCPSIHNRKWKLGRLFSLLSPLFFPRSLSGPLPLTEEENGERGGSDGLNKAKVKKGAPEEEGRGLFAVPLHSQSFYIASEPAGFLPAWQRQRGNVPPFLFFLSPSPSLSRASVPPSVEWTSRSGGSREGGHHVSKQTKGIPPPLSIFVVHEQSTLLWDFSVPLFLYCMLWTCAMLTDLH